MGRRTGRQAIGGFYRLATAVKLAWQECEHVLLLDAGDAVADSMISKETRGEAVIRLMNALLNMMPWSIGNHHSIGGVLVALHCEARSLLS